MKVDLIHGFYIFDESENYDKIVLTRNELEQLYLNIMTAIGTTIPKEKISYESMEFILDSVKTELKNAPLSKIINIIDGSHN